MKRNLYASAIAALFCLFSCENKQSINPLIRSELVIDDDLSSISLDSFNSLWLGSENGKIYNFSNFNLKSYDLHEDIIYKLNYKIWKKDTLLWAGARNNGLQIWKFNKENKPVKIKTFTIGYLKNKYSPYDFIFDRDTIYVATSFGLYKTNIESQDSEMELLVPSPEKKNTTNNILYITHNLCSYNDSIILGSTSNGLFSYNKKNKKTEYLIKNTSIDYVSVFQDTIYAVNEKYLFYKGIKNDNWKKIPQINNCKLYFKNTRKLSYEFSSDALAINNTDNHSTVKVYNKFPLNFHSRNLILTDTINQYTYFISSQGLWRIPFYDGLKYKNQEEEIIASCFNSEKSVFFLTSKNELYVKNYTSSKVKWLYSFDKEQEIKGIDCIGKYLFFYNSKNEIYQMKLPYSWYTGLINNPKLIFTSPSKIITAYSDANTNLNMPNYYIGTQDGLYYLNNENKIVRDSISKNMYVTSFYKQRKHEGILFSTLNDGIYYKKKTI